MKTASIALLLLALAIPASADVPLAASIHLNPSGAPSVDLGFFFDSLSPHGKWVETPAYGWAFAPTVESSWRPYTDGRWIQSDAGWTWLSEEPFGWATYHYGRWDLNPDYGWLWVPGDQWAPAWVDWRATDDIIGWAPLPPSYVVNPRLSFRRANVVLPPEAYVFVPQREFLSSRVAFFALPPGQAKKLFRSSRQFTRYRFANNLIINDGVPFVTVQRGIGRRIPRYQLVDLEPRLWRQRARFAGNQVALFRPTIQRNLVAVPPARHFARRSVMTVTDSVRVRRLARARAVSFGLPSSPRLAAVTRPGRANVRVVEPLAARFRGDRSRLERSGRDFGKSRGVGKDVRKQQVRPQREAKRASGRKVEVRTQGKVRSSRGQSEVRRSSRAAPTRQIKAERRSSNRSKSLSSGGRSRAQKQVRQSSGGGSRQRAVKQSRGGGGRRATVQRGGGGGGGRKAAVRSGGGGRQGKRGGGRGKN